MKKRILFIALFLGFIAAQPTQAQISLNLNFNVGQQPVWGPVGYDRADYYYMPDIDVFYNISNRQYIYQDNNRWIFSVSLPQRYRNYDLYSGYKVVVNDYRPYRNVQIYRNKYAGFKGRRDQPVIRNSHENKYFENENHPEHKNWKDDNKRNKENGNNNGRGNGKGKGNNKH